MEAGHEYDPIEVAMAADSKTSELLDEAEAAVRRLVEQKQPESLQELHRLVDPSFDSGLVSLAILELLSRDELELTEEREPRLAS